MFDHKLVSLITQPRQSLTGFFLFSPCARFAASLAPFPDSEPEDRGGGQEPDRLPGQREAQGGRRRQEGLQRRGVPQADLGLALQLRLEVRIEEAVRLSCESKLRMSCSVHGLIT